MIMNFVRQERWIIQLFVLLFCLSHCCILLSGIASAACEEYQKDIDYWTRRVTELEQALADVEAKNPLLLALKGAGIGAGVGAAGGAAGGAVVGAVLGPPGAGVGALKGALGGAVAGVIGGATTALLKYRSDLKAARAALEAAKNALKDAQDNYKKYRHDDTPPQGSLTPYMNSPTYVRYGETHYAHFSANMAFDSVYWYVRAPGESGYGTNITTDTGDGTRTDSTFSYTPNASGTYTITAYTYFSSTIIEPSYDITVTN